MRSRIVVVALAAALAGWACTPPAVQPAPRVVAPAEAAAPVVAAAPEPPPPSREELEREIRAEMEQRMRVEIARAREEARAEAAAEAAARASRESDFPVRTTMEMSSTAYCLKGNMRTGVRTRDGMAAGDPRVIPLGSVVRVSHPDGRRIGIFVIMDTGGAIRGNKIDIYMDSCREAIDWGRRPVVVEVLAIGRT